MGARHLHLDVSGGARADALLGALLDALPPDPGTTAEALVVDALRAVGLPDARLVRERVRAQGVRASAVHLALAVDEPAATGPVPGSEVVARGAAAKRARRPFRYQRDARAPDAAAAGGVAVQPPPEDSMSRARPALRPTAPGRRSAPAVALVDGWCGGAFARPRDLTVVLRGSALGPVAKALALRAATRLVEALGAVRGDVEEPVWDGPSAARAVGQIAIACTVLDALDVDLVTASAVAVSSDPASALAVADGIPGPLLAPSPWVSAVLDGVPCVDLHVPIAPIDLVGAALVRACASQLGARGWFVGARQSFGVARGPHAVPALTRVLLGPAPPVATRAGEARRAAAVELRARVARDADRTALADALRAAGVVEQCVMSADDVGGDRHLWVVAQGPRSAVDGAVRALLRAGARRVTTAPCETRVAAVEEMTVPVGRGRTKQAVRVMVIADEDGAVLSTSAQVEDVRNVARAQRRPEELIRAEALAACLRLRGAPEDSPHERADEEHEGRNDVDADP